MASLPFGSAYDPPLHDEPSWERDIQALAAAGQTVIRVGGVLASWDRIERSRSQMDWAALDRLFDLAARHDIKIVLATGVSRPPLHLLDRLPDIQIVNHDGIRHPAMRPCLDHPGYRATAERYLRQVLQRYSQHPALGGWQPDERPDSAMMAATVQFDESCFCSHTVAAFRRWLQQRYPTIKALNAAWGSHYPNRESIRPPRLQPSEGGALAIWLDWQRFALRRSADFVAWQQQIIKVYDPQHVVSITTWPAHDPWLLARQVDSIGFDLHPGSRWLREPDYVPRLLAYGRSVALHGGADFWLSDLESGAAGGPLGAEHLTNANDIRRWCVQAIGHGAKAVLFHSYRESPFGVVSLGALTDIQGRPTGRAKAAAEVGALLRQADEALLAAEPPRSEVAILADPINRTLLAGMNAAELYDLATRGAFAGLWQAGYQPEFVDPVALQQAKLPYKLIVLPFAFLLDQATGDALRRFVDSGGTLVVFARCGSVDERGWGWPDRPGAGLHDLCGVEEIETERRDAITILPQLDAPLFADLDEPFAGYWHVQQVRLAPEANVIARFLDGEPAVIHRRFGAGQVFTVATHLDAATVVHGGPLYTRWWANLCAVAGVTRPLLVEGKNSAGTIDATLLAEDRVHFICVANNSLKDQLVRLILPSAAPNAVAHDLFAGVPVPEMDEPRGPAWLLSIGAWRSTIIRIAAE